MERNKPVYISLTGENSHRVIIPPGQGSFSIGTKGVSEGKYDVYVEKESRINWNAFNGFYTPHGRQNADAIPYGDWPRFFYYSGNDSGFIEWSERRAIEDFNWSPCEDVIADLTGANIRRLFLHAGENRVAISTGDKLHSLFLSGNLENITIGKCAGTTFLYFAPAMSKAGAEPYRLPVYEALRSAVSVEISVPVVGQAFDCRSLLQFPALTALTLSGNVTGLEALAELEHLERLVLRNVPDLTGMPGLAAWKNMNGFVGWNIEEMAGKALAAEFDALSKEREFQYSGVSRLRKKIWFTTEYGIPFADWNDRKSRTAATKAYKTCLKEIKRAKTEDEAHKAITAFVEALNTLPNMETTEREDAGIAVGQLVESSALNLSQEVGNRWFDEVRDF